MRTADLSIRPNGGHEILAGFTKDNAAGFPAELFRVGACAVEPGFNNTASVRHGHQPVQAERPVARAREPRYRRTARPVEQTEKSAFSRQFGSRGCIVDGRHKHGGALIADAAFHTDAALAERGREGFDVEQFSDVCLKLEPLQAGLGQQRRIALAAGELVEAGADIAAEIDHPQVGPYPTDQRLPPQ